MSGKITNTFSTTVILSNKWDLTHVTSFQSTTTLCQYSTLMGGSVALLVQPRPLLSEPVPGKFRSRVSSTRSQALATLHHGEPKKKMNLYIQQEIFDLYVLFIFYDLIVIKWEISV